MKINKRKRKVLRINPKDLTDVKLYESITDAAVAMNCSKDSISAVCARYPSCITVVGYYWCFKESYNAAWNPTDNSTLKKVICIETGAIYNSLFEAVKLTKISVIPEYLTTHKTNLIGYHWAYNDDKYRKNKYKKFFNVQPLSRKVECIETGQKFKSAHEVFKKLGIRISSSLKHSEKTCGELSDGTKLHWQYIYDDEQWKEMLSHVKSNKYKVMNLTAVKKEIVIRHVKQYGNKNKGSVICVETGIIYPNTAEAQRRTGLKNIYLALHKTRKSCGGFTWNYVQDENKGV